METQELKIQVKVDAETGKIQLVNAELKNTEKNLNDASTAGQKNKIAIDNLIKRYFGLIATFGTLTSTIRGAIKNYDDEITRQKQLELLAKNLGVNYESLKNRTEKMLETLAHLSKFTGDELFDAFNVAIKVTGDSEQAFKLLKIAMDVAAGTGKNLNEVLNIFKSALARGSESSVILAREFGTLGKNGADTGEIIKNLGKTFEGASESQDTFAKKGSQLKDVLNNLLTTLGGVLLPLFKIIIPVIGTVFVGAINGLTNALIILKKAIYATVEPFLLLYKFTTKGFKGAKEEAENFSNSIKNMGSEIVNTNRTASHSLNKLWGNFKKETIKIDDLTLNSLKKTEEKTKKETKKIEKDNEEMIKKIAGNTENVLAKGFDDLFNNIINSGQLTNETLKEVFTNIYTGFRDMLIKMVAEMMARAVLFSLFNIFTGGTGTIGGIALEKIFGGFQVGGTVPRTGSYILHEGEKVISKENSGYFSDNLNNKTNNVNVSFNVLDARTLDKRTVNRLSRNIAPYIKRSLK